MRQAEIKFQSVRPSHYFEQRCMAMPLDDDQDERTKALFEDIRAQKGLIGK